MEYHEYANLFPMVTGSDFEGLKEDIKENGLLNPVVLYEGKILDGRNRFRACQEIGQQPEFEDYEGDNPLEYVISLNLHRRHLNESQRAMVAARLANIQVGSTGGRAKIDSANLQSQSRAEAAEKLNVSERSVNTAKKVQTKAIPEVQEKVNQGQLAVSAASEIADQPEEVQHKLIQKLETGEAKNVKQAKRQFEQEERVKNTIKTEDQSIRILLGDCVQLANEMTDRPALVITDPPYGIETHNTRKGGKDYQDGEGYALQLLENLCDALLRKCLPGAHLYFFSGYSFCFHFKEILKTYFEVQDNPIIWVKDNHTMCDFSKSYPNKHEYIWFCKAPGADRKLTKCIPDVIQCKRERSTTHSAEKPTELLEILIEQSSTPGELILDPFVGSGSTAVAAKNTDRNFIGFELDEGWLDVARSRI
jgi:DNA modification methylase